METRKTAEQLRALKDKVQDASLKNELEVLINDLNSAADTGDEKNNAPSSKNKNIARKVADLLTRLFTQIAARVVADNIEDMF